MSPEEISKLINKRIFFNNLGFLFGAMVVLSSYHVKDNNNQSISNRDDNQN